MGRIGKNLVAVRVIASFQKNILVTIFLGNIDLTRLIILLLSIGASTSASVFPMNVQG